MTDRVLKGAESKVIEELNKSLELDEKQYMGIYADYLIANGVILPPCDIGKTVYKVSCLGEIVPLNVANFRCSVITSPYMLIPFDNFGKTVFLTPEEAEEKLKEIKNNA